MLWNASAIKGYAVDASDGPVGTVAGLMFEDVDWRIRWLLVDTGTWLPGRKLLLPVSALGQPDPNHRRCAVALTMQQIEAIPAIDMEEPIALTSETRMREYFAIRYDHDGDADRTAAPQATALAERAPRLRNLAVISGATVTATDGDIGSVDDFMIDTAAWYVQYIVVDTGNWLPGVKVRISPRSVHAVDWSRGVIELDVSRQKVQDSPPYDAESTVDGAFEEKFNSYYGIRFSRR